MLHHRILSFGTFLFITVSLIGQDLVITPKWKKDDTRTMFVTRVQQETENDSLTEDVTDRLDAKVKISSMSATTYMLEMEYQNVVLVMAKELTDALGSELDPWRKMLLRYEVDRRTGEAVLYNWQDVREVVNGSFSEIKRSWRKKDPEAAEQLIPILDVMVSAFQEPAAVDAYFREGIDMLTFAFNKPLTLGQPLVITEVRANPLSDGKDSLKVMTTIHLDQLDKEAGRCTIRSSQEWEMEPFLIMMKEMMTKMMRAGGTSKTQQARSKAEIEKAIASMKFEMSNERTLVVDLEGTWPIRAGSNVRVVSHTPDGTSVRTVNTNAEIR